MEIEELVESTEEEVTTSGNSTVTEQPPSEALAQEQEERSPVFEVRVEKATELWEQGKASFRAEDVAGAQRYFERGLHQVDFDELSYNFELMDIHRAAVDKVRTPLWLNMAACLLRTDKYKEAVEYCDKVLKQDPNSVKGLYRRAKAREGMGELELALEDLDKARRIAKDDPEVTRALAAVKLKCQEAQRMADDMWRGKMKLPSKGENDGTVSKTAASSLPKNNFLVEWFWNLVSWIMSVFPWLSRLLSSESLKTKGN